MGWRKLEWVFFFILLIHLKSGFAQQPNLEFNTFTALEKITNSKANAIIQDPVGYVWIGTEEGLFRYDGQTVYTYQNIENDPSSIPSNIVNKLIIDSDKNIWICTIEGLCIYNPEYDNFTSIVVQSDLRGLPSAFITAIEEDNTGQIFVACDRMLYRYDKSRKQFVKVTELKQGTINALVFDDQNNIWIGASMNGGLNYYNQKTQQLSSFIITPTNKKSILSQEILDIKLVKDILWIATNGGGIHTYNLSNKTFKQYIFPVNLENFAVNILIDSKKNIWIVTYGGLKLFNLSTDSFYDYFHEPNNPGSIGGSLWDIYEDKQGNYWTIYTEGGIKIVKHKNKFKSIDSHPGKFWRTSNQNTTSVSVDSKGNLWAGYYLSGADVFKWKEKKTDRYQYKKNDPKGIGNGSAFSIICDSKNQVWIGSYLGGLQKYRPETKDFESYLNQPNDTMSIAINDVRSISEDKNGDLWLAVQGKGVDRFDMKTKTFHHFNAKNNLLSNDYTFQVLNDSRENLWVATSWGLNLLQKGERTFKNFINSKNDQTTINNNIICSICEDQQQNIWIGTPDGLNKFDYAAQTFTRYSAGLKNKHIGAILCDQKNNLWVSTNVGISRFDQKKLHFINFDQSDGLLSRDFFDRSCYKDNQNNLYFGGSEGVDFFNPDSLNTEKKQPRVVLTDFKIFNKSITWKTDSAIINKNISYADKIILSYKSNSFTFLYQAINPVNPDAITFTYRLDGFDKSWIDAETKREASYTNLSPGKYTFRVKAKYDNEDWRSKETTIDLEIVPAWWMTIWFKILVTLILLITPFVFVYLRTKRYRKQKKNLEKIVTERTNEINQKNDLLKSQALSLEQKNDLLKSLNSTKDKLFSIISHDLRSPFNTILGFQNLLLDDYFELSDPERLAMIKQVYTTTNQVYDLVENLLNWSSIQTSIIRYHPVNLNLKEIIHQKLDLYRNIAESKGVSLDYDVTESMNAFADINLLETSLRNLINNAIKFTSGGGNILVKASIYNDVIQVSVIDSGTGMTQEQIENLFNSEKTQTKNGTGGEKGSGLGLILCKEFVEKNKGTLSVESQLGKGSTFSFTLPATPIV